MAADKQNIPPANEETSRWERLNLNDYFREIDDKNALKAHSTDTPEGLRRALDEALGAPSGPVRPGLNNL